MFYNDPMDLSAFSTSFCFRIGERGGIDNALNPDSGADGIAFLIQPFGPDYIAHTGGGQGYEGADPSLAIEFDCWDNGPAYSEPSRSHVGVMVDGVIDHLIDHMVQARTVVGVADVHAGALANSVQPLENLDGIGAVFGHVGSRIGHEVGQ